MRADPKPFTDQWNPSRANKMIVPGTSDSPYRPFILWFETLPSGDTAQVYLLPRPNGCGLVGKWNGQAVRTETCATEAEAERLAWEWWNELPNLMGIGPDDLAEVSIPWRESVGVDPQTVPIDCNLCLVSSRMLMISDDEG